ncbi:uncharacterized protein B0I36DRAFT_323110 [Microdochium trichocladiopsis]|uniref:RRN7-type domain-containing protein n=1 Tax=Microdochium trichocladiopsis TaxID=1682393 RepID=A0A9P8Y6W3_9PEZI|nr:uncharacterized protein B0I36DRAFT_323110 [Microdochium trichocladiopsis]KAH7031062.1 hypothetical protein B0I36DRAFT_323110 [Microdochium trichocladiopsis]
MSPKYHKFPPGERCEECGSRQWYAQDALRYCRRGHLLEGFAAHSGDEDDFGTQGRTTRKKKEKPQKVAVKLSGDLGRELYLEVLQLVLRKQVWWLVRDRGFPEELEGIVQSLWALRVRSLPLKIVSARKPADDSQGRDDDAMSVSSSMGGGMSSQAESVAGGESSSEWELSDTTTKTWEPDVGRRWKLPHLIDTLALCYLGCLTRRLPVSTSDIHHWAQEGRLEYLSAFTNLPKNVRDRLPAEFHRALQPGDHLKHGRLQDAARDLVLAFRANFDVTFPPVNHVFTIVRYIRDLVLPFELYSICTAIAKIIGADFAHQADGLKRKAMRDPETLMIALVVVSAKLRYPFESSGGRAVGQKAMDWSRWEATRHSKPVDNDHITPGEEYTVTANDVLTMDKTKLDDYMDWFESMFLGDENSGTAEVLREPFLGEPRHSESRKTLSLEQEIEQHDKHFAQQYRDMYATSKSTTDSTVPQQRDYADGLWCPIWQTVEDLPDIARFAYKEAADLAAIPLSTLVRACGQIERRLEVVCKERWSERKGKRKDSE